MGSQNKEASATEQQPYQGQERREAPKTEEPPPSAKANQEASSTSTESGQERRRRMWDEWKEAESTEKQRHQKQDKPETPKTKESPTSTKANPDLFGQAVIWMAILFFYVIGALRGEINETMGSLFVILLVLWGAALLGIAINNGWQYHQRQYKTDTPKTEAPIFSIISTLLKIVAGSVLVMLILIYAASIVFKPLTVNPPTPKPSEHQVVTETNQQPVPIFNQPEQPLPQSGANNANFRNGVAPLKIRTSSAGGHHYFVKIVNLSNGQQIGAYFIRSGGTIDIKIPLGTYEIRYASGTKWYGLDYLFGPDTTYSKADSTFDFSFDGYQYSGYTIELIMQQNGNLSTSRIKPNQW